MKTKRTEEDSFAKGSASLLDMLRFVNHLGDTQCLQKSKDFGIVFLKASLVNFAEREYFDDEGIPKLEESLLMLNMYLSTESLISSELTESPVVAKEIDSQMILSRRLSNLGRLAGLFHSVRARIQKYKTLAPQHDSKRMREMIIQSFEISKKRKKLAKRSQIEEIRRTHESKNGGQVCKVCANNDTLSPEDVFIYCEVA